MGMFMQRPEEPEEWAGLPSEPLKPRSGAELLADAGPASELLGEPGEGVASVSIPMPPPVEGDAE